MSPKNGSRLSSSILATAIAVMFAWLGGCTPKVEVGKIFVLPKQQNAVVFGADATAESFMTNQNGKPVLGIVVCGASLLRNTQDLLLSKQTCYVIFWDFLLGNMVRGSYWVQQSEKDSDVGLPAMNTRFTPVSVVLVDSNRVVLETKTLRVGFAEISVSTNDFTRPFVP